MPEAATPGAADDANDSRPARMYDEQALDAALASDPLRVIRLTDQGVRAAFYVAALGGIGVLAFVLAAWDGPAARPGG